jgi:pimeloyl-ACP methyl ester carboxylesterase
MRPPIVCPGSGITSVIIYAAHTDFYGLPMSEEIKKRVRTACEYHVFEEGGHILFYVEDEKFNRVTIAFLIRSMGNKSIF